MFLGFRGTTRALLFAPYIFHFMTSVRGMSATEYGLLQLIYYWVVMGTEVPSGVVADRLGRRGALVLGAVVNAAGTFVFAVSWSFGAFAVGEVLFALGTALISGADSALLYDSFAADRMESRYARAEGSAQATWLVVTAVGMPLTDLFLVRDGDPVLAYWITGGLSLAGAAFALAMREPDTGGRLSTREITTGAVKDVVRVPGLLRLIVVSVGIFVLLRAAIVSFLNPSLDAAGIAVDRFGTILAAVNVVGALTAYSAHRLLARYGARAALAVMPVSMVAMLTLLSVFRNPWLVAGLFLVQGAVFGAYPLVTRTILQGFVPDARRRATIISIESLVCRVAFGLVALFAGWSLDTHGLATAVLATAALGCVPFLAVPLFRKQAL